ncbi:MAG: DUF3108 domain-containing protein [Glaciimonas sp.]|nr:DUF3108 domain-containing protein [Glaciimonas sp.]
MTKSACSTPPVQPKRWLALLLASVLLHGMVLNLTGWRIGIPTPAALPPSHNVITAQLRLRQTPKLTSATPVSPSHTVQRPVARPKSKHSPTPKSAPSPNAPTIATMAPETPTVKDQIDSMAEPDSSIEPAVALTPDGAPPVSAAKTESVVASDTKPAAALQQAIDPPPPVLMKYEVQSKKEGKAVYGSGKIAWNTDGHVYTVNGEASVLFFTVLEFRSEGAIDSFGVSPQLYSEKRFRKSATNTHFQREPKIISFSASTLTYPRQGGEQDRASIVWQLAALGRGDSSRFVPDVQIEVMVAGVRDAETWPIRVIGLEQIQIPAGQMEAWHLVRQPRPGSFDQKIDIWLAPQKQWYPVRLRYTENNGDYLDMAASVIEPIAPPSTSSQE